MPSPEEIATVAQEWTVKAEEDLNAAEYLLKAGKRCPTATVGFHAQQCVEKYLKAVLVLRGIEFPKTHDIERLIGLLPFDIPVVLSVPIQRTLTGYGTITRYPGDYEPVTLNEARRAVAAAKQVRLQVRETCSRAS